MSSVNNFIILTDIYSNEDMEDALFDSDIDDHAIGSDVENDENDNVDSDMDICENE